MRYMLTLALLPMVLLFVSCGPMSMTPSPAGMGNMGGMQPPPNVPNIPPVKGYTEGQEIYFIHTEASTPEVASMLTTMMHSPVLVVPSLAQAPEAMLASVYAFKNGVSGEGPFGFQPDVFDRPPADPAYSPLRALHLVTWNQGAQPRELRSAADLLAAKAQGQLQIERTGAVVNMPFVTWPGGKR